MKRLAHKSCLYYLYYVPFITMILTPWSFPAVAQSNSCPQVSTCLDSFRTCVFGPGGVDAGTPDASPVADAGAPADAGSSIDPTGLLPLERQALWNPGLRAAGGIPSRSTICATLSPSGASDTAAIQAAIDACPSGQVVRLGTGVFNLTGDGVFIQRSDVTLRGDGPAFTRLVKPAGTNSTVLAVGTSGLTFLNPVNLAADAPQGAYTVTLASIPSPPLKVGEMVVVDELADPKLTRWADGTTAGGASHGWFGEMDRPLGQVLDVKSIAGASVTFTTPLHIAFTTANTAHLARFGTWRGLADMVKNVGIENLYVSNGEGGDGGGNIHFYGAAYSWVKNVESDKSGGSSVNLDRAFRCEVRDSYFHSTVSPNPGGGGYGIVLDRYASDNLVENNISWNFNKVMVMRTTGGGNVIGYNYMEDAWGAGYPTVPEVGMNASHMTTPHHELFEGNQSFNFDSDSVWGNSVYITVFRNHLTGHRRSVAPLQLTDPINPRAIGLTYGHYWYSFLGNVLGTLDQKFDPPNYGFIYEYNPADGNLVPMWKLGYKVSPLDPVVAATAIRHGNYDYVTKTTHWDSTIARRDLPASLYLTSKPAFFGAAPWPQVTPENAVVLNGILPARARFDAMSTPLAAKRSQQIVAKPSAKKPKK